MAESRTQQEAWIGDGVLGLYARLRILRLTGAADGQIYARMTSNRFLSAFGDPTEVEARIGRVYEADGLEAAFDWIERKIVPVFDKQEKNRRRR